jgi:hypothetical protein
MKGFVRIGLSTYQMMEVDPEEMDELMKQPDCMLWPLRFDRNKRVWPMPWQEDIMIFFRDGTLR